MEELKKEIEQIKIRNTKVELDKKWETSFTRRICICILTYIVVIIYSYLINKISNINFKVFRVQWLCLMQSYMAATKRVSFIEQTSNMYLYPN